MGKVTRASRDVPTEERVSLRTRERPVVGPRGARLRHAGGGNDGKQLGWQVQCVDTAEDCLETLGGSKPYLLVCDHKLEGRDELVAQIKTSWRTNTVPVVTLHTPFDDLKHPDSRSVQRLDARREARRERPAHRSLETDRLATFNVIPSLGLAVRLWTSPVREFCNPSSTTR